MMDESERSWPEWLGPLCEEIARELDQLDRSQDAQRPDLEREAADLRACLDGWAISLAKPDLSPGVREDIEEQYDRARARLQTLRSDLAGLEARQARHRGLVDPRQVLGSSCIGPWLPPGGISAAGVAASPESVMNSSGRGNDEDAGRGAMPKANDLIAGFGSGNTHASDMQ